MNASEEAIVCGKPSSRDSSSCTAGNEFLSRSLNAKHANKKDAMTDVFTDAIALLKAEHRKMKDLFRQFEHAKSALRRKELAQEICSETEVHLQIEEEMFHSCFDGNEDHESAKMMVRDIKAALAGDIAFTSMVAALSRQIGLHIHDQESLSGGLFASSRKSGLDLIELQKQIEVRRKELLVQSELRGLAAAQAAVPDEFLAAA